MTCIGITGVGGLLGFHLRAFLLGKSDVTVKCADRAVFFDNRAMDEFLDGLDVVVHLAYINRGSDHEVGETNLEMASRIVEACERQGKVGQIVFSSSTHIHRETLYGKSKRDCADIFREWAKRRDGVFSNIIFPHVFGEHGKPFSNSVVSTFCYQLANGESPVIDHDGELELLHAQAAAASIFDAVAERRDGDIDVAGSRIRVSRMLEMVSGMAESYRRGIMPGFHDPLSLRLFNTWRSYIFPAYYPVPLKLHSDERGSLFEAVKSDNGGQTFISTTKPGIVRGNHFHYHKVERFLVVRGEAVIALRRLFSDEVTEFRVSGDTPQFIDMPTLHTHNITNVGDGELMTLFWAHEIFDPECPDTIFEPVYREAI